MMLATMSLFHRPGSFSGQALLAVRSTFSFSFSLTFSLSREIPMAAETDFQPRDLGFPPLDGVPEGDGRFGGVPCSCGGVGRGEGWSIGRVLGLIIGGVGRRSSASSSESSESLVSGLDVVCACILLVGTAYARLGEPATGVEDCDWCRGAPFGVAYKGRDGDSVCVGGGRLLPIMRLPSSSFRLASL